MRKKEKSTPGRDRKSKWAGLLLVLVAALTLEATSLIQSYFTKNGIREESSRRADSHLVAIRDQILDVIDQAELAVRNNVWVASLVIDRPDSLSFICRRIVEDNDAVVGSTVAMVPGYRLSRPLFAPYYFIQDDSLHFRSLATEAYNYPETEWFRKPIELGEGYWSEPYVDEGGGDMLMTTFSMPVRDRRDKIAAILTADISLDWLTDLVSSDKAYPNAVNFIISRDGRFMVSPEEEAILEKKIDDVIVLLRDSVGFRKATQAMLAGESGNMPVLFRDQLYYIYYAPVKRTGWSLAILVPHDDIYGAMRRIDWIVRLLQILGLAMLILILRAFVRSRNRYFDLNERKERMEGDLQIARKIQMSMVPKPFSELSGGNNLDISATIISAKEVGGDLYDYYIRDGRLFFCIGDVSGKGVPASLVMAVTRTVFRTVSAQEDNPALIVKRMNEGLEEMNENNMFVTFFCGVLDLSSGHLSYCNAGHNPPMILTDEIQTLPVEPNLPLGLDAGMDYVGQEVNLQSDDAIFLYTDGLTEAENEAHEQFGEERTKEALHGRKSSEAHLREIGEHVSVFVGDAPRSDDLTMLFIHYLGKGHHLTLTNDISQISRLKGFVERVVGSDRKDSPLASELNLALEEAVSNVIFYAYPKGTKGTVELNASCVDDELHFVLSDHGRPFDPTAVPEVDVNAGMDERRIGGLGIHLVRKIMDSVEYTRKDGENILSLTKKI